MVQIDILGIERDGGDIVATVTVATDQQEFIEYEFLASHDPGGETTVAGQLFGTSGSFPGDSETHEIRVEDVTATSGVLTVELVEGGDDTDTVEWSDTNGTGPGEPGSGQNLALLGAGALGLALVADRLRD